MNKPDGCPLADLDQALAGSITALETSALEIHLESCEKCQGRLQNLAAEENYWEKASRHLSVAHDVQPPLSDSVVLSRTEIRETVPATSSPLLDAPSHPELLGRIDHFEIEQEIGRGGCGVVYRGLDTHLNRPVAIKFLAPHLSANGVARKRFAREARAAAAVVHPNVVPIHNVSSSVERPYIVMSLVDGRSLESHVRQKGPFEIKETVRVATQIASGLGAAHRQGLIHRDIKPANILLEQDVSRVMITDFGLARAADDRELTQTGWLAGTPHYMSPEQAQGEPIDHRSDLFSLGSVLYFMATGEEPFRAEKPFAVMQGIISRPHLPACAANPDVSPTLSQIIDKLLEKDPRDRFQSAEEAHDTLEKYLAYLNNPNSSPRVGRILTRRQRKRRVRLGLITGVTMVVATLAIVFGPGLISPSPKPTNPRTAIGERRMAEVPRLLSAPAAGPFSRSMDSVKTFDQIEQEIKEIEKDIRALESELLSPELPNLD